MARPRSDTANNYPREPHSISLKVLRLSRPSLVQQYPLPRDMGLEVPRAASLAYPSNKADQNFLISSNLGLPPAFGLAHVGETFSCSLCANNELPEGKQISRVVSGLRVVAEMQTPSQAVVPLQLSSADREDETQPGEPGSSLQNIIRFDLKEEGNHVLAVNVSYTETTNGDGQATSGRSRSFRKLYQFVAQPCLSVRTKATELRRTESQDRSTTSHDRTPLLRYVLEAQLENVSEGTIVLEEAKLQARQPFEATSLNWDVEAEYDKPPGQPVLNVRDVLQVAFVVEQQRDVLDGLEELRNNLSRDGRAVLGQLAISWRSSMGEKGFLSTGNLLTRRRT